MIVALILFHFSLFLSASSGTVDPPYGSCLHDGLTMADPANAKAYFVCCDRFWLIKYCTNNEIFDKWNLTCTSDNLPPTIFRRSISQPDQESTTPPTTCTAGQKVKNPFDETKYDECVNGTHMETLPCPAGQRFNENTLQCQQLPIRMECRPGEKRGAPHVGPKAYYICANNGRWGRLLKCLGKSFFDGISKQCVFRRRPFVNIMM